jgi:D-alanyl-D-alanine dipeptidase
MKNIRILLNRIKLLTMFILKGNIREATRYFLWLINFQEILPKFVIDKIVITENDSALVEIKTSNRLIVTALIPKVREEIRSMLNKATGSLPDDYLLCLVSAYRDRETQQEYWKETLDRIKIDFPYLSQKEQERKSRLLIADPSSVGPHQTGGAIDVVLLNRDRERISMGTKYRENTEKTPMFSKYCTKEEKKNRSILRGAMLKAGFWYYPGEWWHYCYGDRMWAAYTGNDIAIYGSVNE